jgi:hypothetical protein
MKIARVLPTLAAAILVLNAVACGGGSGSVVYGTAQTDAPMHGK